MAAFFAVMIFPLLESGRPLCARPVGPDKGDSAYIVAAVQHGSDKEPLNLRTIFARRANRSSKSLDGLRAPGLLHALPDQIGEGNYISFAIIRAEVDAVVIGVVRR